MAGIEISKKLVIINSASAAVALVMNLSVLVWLQQYLLRRITPEEYSLIPLVMAVLAFTPLLTIILTSGLGRYITIAYAKNNDAEITQICSTMFPILVGAGLVLLGIGWFGAWHINIILEIPTEYVRDARKMMALLVFSAAIRLPLAVFGSGFIVRQKLLLQDLIDTGCQFLRIGMLFALLYGFGPKAVWVTVALVSSELVKMAITTPISLKLIPSQRIRISTFKWSVAKELTGYGGWGFINQVGETFKNLIEPIFLNWFASAVDVSVYHVASIVPRQLQQILFPITRPFIPILSAMYATGDSIRLRNTYLRTARYHAWVLLFFSAPILVFNNELMHLYLGGQYENTGPIMALLLVVAILRSFNALGYAITAAAGVLKEVGLRMLVVRAIDFFFFALFVVIMGKGSLGAAFANLFACLLFETTIVWPYCRRIAHTPTTLWIKEVVYCTVLPAIPSFLFCIASKILFPINSWAMLFLISAGSGVLYFVLVTLYGLRSQDRIDLSRLSAKLPEPLKGFMVSIANRK